MQKNKKSLFEILRGHWSPFSLSNKKLFILLLFVVFFGVCFYLIWERHFQYVKSSAPQDVLTKYEASSSLPPSASKPAASCEETTALLQLSNQLIALELIKGVLNQTLSLDDLKGFIHHHHAKPWISALSHMVTPLEEIQSYPALENGLVLPTPPAPKDQSFWHSLTEKVRSFISIRKLSKKEDPSSAALQEIKQALKTHNISGALHLFEKLPPTEKAALSEWEKKARDRLLLEKAQKMLLLQMATGQSE